MLNVVKNRVTFQKSSKSLFFEKIVTKYPKINHTYQNLGMSVSMLKHVKYFFSKKKKMLHRSRLAGKISTVQELVDFVSFNWLSKLTYLFNMPSSTTYLKKCWKYAKLLHILRVLLQIKFFHKKATKTQKIICKVSQKPE